MNQNTPAEKEVSKGKLCLTMYFGDEIQIGNATVIITRRNYTQYRIVVQAPKDMPVKRIKEGKAVEKRPEEKGESDGKNT